jgi:hypothetical protein
MGESSDSNGGKSSLKLWEEKGRLSGSGRQDRVMVAKECGAFKSDRHRDENEAPILGACAVQSFIAVSFVDGDGDDVRGAGCGVALRVCASRD